MTTSDPYAAGPAIVEAGETPAPPTPAPVSLDAETGPDAAEPDLAESVPADATIRDLLAWVDGDAERAQRALDAEQARENPRKRAIADLEELIGG